MYVDYARRCALIRNKKLKNLQVILKHTVTHGHDNKRRKIEGFVLKKIDMNKVDYVFLDGGHDYKTVKNDLNCCSEVINNNGTILCDDYNLSYAPGVKKAIDEFVKQNNLKCEILLNSRFAKIEKN